MQVRPWTDRVVQFEYVFGLKKEKERNMSLSCSTYLMSLSCSTYLSYESIMLVLSYESIKTNRNLSMILIRLIL